MKRKLQIGIIGSEEKNLEKDNKEKLLSLAYEIGKGIASKNEILITGGCSGIAEAACKGASEEDGITVGTPGPKRFSSVESVLVEICTPINIGDYIFAGILSSDAIIVFPGDAGTLAEFAIAYRYKKPLIFIKGIGDDLLEKLFLNVDKDYPQYVVDDANSAVNLAIKLAKNLET